MGWDVPWPHKYSRWPVDSAVLYLVNRRKGFHTYLSAGVMEMVWLGILMSSHGVQGLFSLIWGYLSIPSSKTQSYMAVFLSFLCGSSTLLYLLFWKADQPLWCQAMRCTTREKWIDSKQRQKHSFLLSCFACVAANTPNIWKTSDFSIQPFLPYQHVGCLDGPRS